MWWTILGLVILGVLIYLVRWMRKEDTLPYLTPAEKKARRVERMADEERANLRDRRRK